MKDKVYKNWFGFEIPDEHIPTNEDMIQVSSGDITIAVKLIEGLTEFIVKNVDWFLFNSKEAQPFREDCISEALLALTEFVYFAVEKNKTYSPTHFVNTARQKCLYRVVRWLREMSIAVTIPERRQRLNPELRLTSHELEDYESGELGVEDKMVLYEFLNSLDERGQVMIRMKIAGCSHSQIAEEVGIDASLVKDQLQEYWESFNE